MSNIKNIENLFNLEKISYELAYRNFKHFFKRAWRFLEPGKELLYNWHIDLICEYLEACYLRQIKRLIINIPPRYLKSSLVTVTFPTWIWTHDPTERFLFASYAQTLSTFHSKRRRDLIESSWYQRGWGDSFKMASDQNVKTEYENDKKGYMIATSLHGSATGKGGNWLIFDDPHDAEKVLSETRRMSDIDVFNQKFITRLDDTNRGVIIVIMQRLHEDDMTGHLLDKNNEEWQHLCLPSNIEYEPKTLYFPISKKKILREINHILHPKRHDLHKLNQLKKSMGLRKYSAQFLQNPTPEEGDIFKKKFWQYYTSLPNKFDEIIDSWDMSFKDLNTSDYVVGTVWGRKGANCYLLHMTRNRMGFADSIRAVKAHRERFPELRKTLIEDKANGPGIIELLKKKIGGIISFNPGNKSKIERAYMIEPLLEAGNIFLPVKQIATFDIELLIDECAKFPNAKNDDIVDSITQALIKLDTSSKNTLSAMGWY